MVSGTGINFLAIGITGYVFIYHYGDQGTPSDISRVPNVTLPLVEDIPFIGEAIGRLNLLTWAALLLVPILTVYLFRTRGGLRLRSVGEKPRAADSLGLPVLRTRYLAVTASGALAAARRRVPFDRAARLVQRADDRRPRLHRAGGGDLRQLAPVRRAWPARCLFGFSTALAQRLPAFSESAAVLFQALPYVLTLVVVAGVIGRSRPPAAIGVPYVKE